MPQMWPMNWFILYLIFTMLFLVIFSKIYSISNFKPKFLKITSDLKNETLWMW